MSVCPPDMTATSNSSCSGSKILQGVFEGHIRRTLLCFRPARRDSIRSAAARGSHDATPHYPRSVLRRAPFSEGYYRAESYHGNPGDPAVIAQDPAAVLVLSGLRMYFGLYDRNALIPESGIYGMSTTTIH